MYDPSTYCKYVLANTCTSFMFPPMRAPQSNKESVTFRFHSKNKRLLIRYAKRKRRTMTSVLEEFIEKGCLLAKEEV